MLPLLTLLLLFSLSSSLPLDQAEEAVGAKLHDIASDPDQIPLDIVADSAQRRPAIATNAETVGEEELPKGTLEKEKLLPVEKEVFPNLPGTPFTALCEHRNRGDVIQALHSGYNQANGERKFAALCANLIDIGLEHPDGLEWHGSNWQWVKRRLDIPESQVAGSQAKSWVSGCRDYEILVGINSVFWEGVRRYEFVCVEYLTVRVNQSTCRLTHPSDIASNFSIVTSKRGERKPQVFRTVRTTYNPATRDREFEFEICQVYSVPKWPLPEADECRFRRSTTNQEETEKIREKVFGKMRSGDEHECAQICAAHPFCTSFIWSPALSLPAVLNCELSYEKHDPNFCDSATVFETGFSHRKEYLSVDEHAIAIPCFQCPELDSEDAADPQRITFDPQNIKNAVVKVNKKPPT